MPNFVPLAELDVWPLSASLRNRMNLFSEEGALTIVGDDATDLEKWPNLRNVLSRIGRIDQDFEIARGMLDLLHPGAARDWDRPTFQAGLSTLHLPIVSNMGCMNYAGTESLRLIPGVLYLTNNAVMCSEVNFGQTPRIHLVLEVRKRAE